MTFRTHVQIEEDVQARLDWQVQEANRKKDVEERNNDNSTDNFIEDDEFEDVNEIPAPLHFPGGINDPQLILHNLGYMK